METMGITSTGIIVRVRATGKEFGLHSECVDPMMDVLASATGLSVLHPDFPAVVIGPLFAEADEWQCAFTDCAHQH